MKIEVNVKTNCKDNKIEIISENKLKVFLKNLPIDNKANKELIKILKKYYKCDVDLLRGFSSKKKIVEIKNGN